MAYVKISSELAKEKLTLVGDQIFEEVKKCREDFERPFYFMEFSWRFFKKVEVKRNWSRYTYKGYTDAAEADGFRVLRLLKLCDEAEEIFVSDDDMALMNGIRAPVWNYNPLPYYAYYKDEEK